MKKTFCCTVHVVLNVVMQLITFFIVCTFCIHSIHMSFCHLFIVSMASSSRNPKHAWTRAEESCLVSCLVDLVSVEGWRSDNGTFRPSYLAQLLRMLAERMPGCKLTSTTVVESRIKLLKRSFQAIAEMCGPVCSGFGWNDDL